MASLLGTVEFAFAGRRLTALLSAAAGWRCPGLPALADHLDAAYPARTSPDEGAPGAATLASAAAALGGTFSLAAGVAEPPGTIH